MDNLPDSYDLIVVGTGMPESIVAAAAARIGKTVLHLDRNEFYGGLWSSFNFEHMNSWIDKQQEPVGNSQAFLEVGWLEQLNDDERLVMCPKYPVGITNITRSSYLRDAPVDNVSNVSNAGGTSIGASVEGSASNCDDQVPESADGNVEENVASQPVASASSDIGQGDAAVDVSELQQGTSETSQGSAEVCEEAAVASEMSENVGEGSSNASEETPVASSPPTATTKKTWTLQDIERVRFKFNIDLTPKVLFSRGLMIELLISSNTARYAEFQSLSRILTLLDGSLEQVPFSRADVFSTKNVSVVEKRMLMKLLTFCLEYEKHPDEYRGYEGRPFIEFLRSRKVTPNIEHYILHAIAMVEDSCLTLQGLSATQTFIESLGRYGNSPFLCTCYGSAELPQCFCRLCAVFGGTYYLGRGIDAIILNSNNRCAGIISQGKKLKCSSLVMEYSYAPRDYLPLIESERIVSRAIYLTDSSILPAERQQNTLLRLPAVQGVRNAITVLEFSSLSFVCPRDLFLVHMTTTGLAETATDDFKSAEEELFRPEESQDTELDGEKRKPDVLWKVQYHHKDVTHTDLNARTPDGIFFTSAPGADLDYNHVVKEAKDIFEKLYPGEEFLPRAPDPEDIVFEEHSNPGNEEKEKEQKVEQNATQDCSNETQQVIEAAEEATEESAASS